MAASIRTTGPRADAGLLMTGVIAASGLLVGGMISSSRSWHLVLVIGIFPIALAVAWFSPRKCLYGLVVWMVMLGFLRRVLPGGGNTTFSGDPLLLVGPAIIFLLFLSAVARGSFRARSPLANAVALLSLFALVEAANPLQGGFKVGLGGLLYILVPMMAFWIGRVYLDEKTLRSMLWLIAVLAVLNALYGLFQTLVHLPSWDERWVHTSGYTALRVGGAIRAFGTFSSSQEYAVAMGIGLMCWVALLRGGSPRRLAVSVVAIALIGTALVLESARGAVVMSVVALGVMVAARTGRRLTGALAAPLAVVALLFFLAAQLGGSVSADSTGTGISALTGHLVSGLADPAHSTLRDHFGELIHGLSEAFTQPLGHGTGSVTVAAGHLQGKSLGTELDPSNMAVAFGLVGLVVYLAMLVRGLTAAYRVARVMRNTVALAVLGILTASCLQWLNGDLYSVSWLVFLLLGWVDVNCVWRPKQVPAAGRRGLPEHPVPALGGDIGSDGQPAG